MAAGALKRFPFYLLALGCFHTSLAAGSATQCVISPTDKADFANLTCYFGEDVGRHQKTFAVFQTSGNSTDTVVSCNFFEPHKPVCQREEGFTAPDTVTDTAVVGIPRAYDSSFYCSLIPRNQSVKHGHCTWQPATPRGTHSKERGETGWSDGYTVAIVLGVGLLAGVIVFVLVRRFRPALCRHRPKSTNRNDGAEIAESGETDTLTPSTDHADGQEGGPPEDVASVDEGPSGQPPEWCQCGNCREMKTVIENLCCKSQPCKATTPQFKAHVLDTAEAFNPTEEELLHDDVLETKRKYAYKCFVIWDQKLVQAGVKTPVPSCCVWAVRNNFPDKEGKYTGFVRGTKLLLDDARAHELLGQIVT